MATEGVSSTTELTVANPDQEVTGAAAPTTAGTGTGSGTDTGTGSGTDTGTTASVPMTTVAAPVPMAQLESLDLFSESTVQQLCDGFLHIFQPELLQVQDSLRELT